MIIEYSSLFSQPFKTDPGLFTTSSNRSYFARKAGIPVMPLNDPVHLATSQAEHATQKKAAEEAKSLTTLLNIKRAPTSIPIVTELARDKMLAVIEHQLTLPVELRGKNFVTIDGVYCADYSPLSSQQNTLGLSPDTRVFQKVVSPRAVDKLIEEFKLACVLGATFNSISSIVTATVHENGEFDLKAYLLRILFGKFKNGIDLGSLEQRFRSNGHQAAGFGTLAALMGKPKVFEPLPFYEVSIMQLDTCKGPKNIGGTFIRADKLLLSKGAENLEPMIMMGSGIIPENATILQ